MLTKGAKFSTSKGLAKLKVPLLRLVKFTLLVLIFYETLFKVVSYQEVNFRTTLITCYRQKGKMASLWRILSSKAKMETF